MFIISHLVALTSAIPASNQTPLVILLHLRPPYIPPLVRLRPQPPAKTGLQSGVDFTIRQCRQLGGPKTAIGLLRCLDMKKILNYVTILTYCTQITYKRPSKNLKICSCILPTYCVLLGYFYDRRKYCMNRFTDNVTGYVAELHFTHKI